MCSKPVLWDKVFPDRPREHLQVLYKWPHAKTYLRKEIKKLNGEGNFGGGLFILWLEA